MSSLSSHSENDERRWTQTSRRTPQRSSASARDGCQIYRDQPPSIGTSALFPAAAAAVFLVPKNVFYFRTAGVDGRGSLCPRVNALGYGPRG
ncbi:hypothetical protein LSAT2_010235, partial [Lamellibrachia satsuma]